MQNRAFTRVLVTGATGLIGSELCGQLAERGHAVVALVHRTRRFVRSNGAAVDLILNSKTPKAGCVVVLAGDIRKPRLGLGPSAASVLAEVDLIVHCAAATGFAPAPDLHRTTNVDGTANVLDFASQGKRRGAPGVVHLSTAYVCGDRSGPISENELSVGQGFANEYEASKAEAEAVVVRSGLRTAIARPSVVVGTSINGCIGRFANIYGLLKLIGEGRIRVLPVASGASLDLVPIDHVIDGLSDIVEYFDRAAGQTFHLVSGDPTPVSTLVAVDYPGFHVPAIVAPEEFDPAELDSAESWLFHNVTSYFASYLRRDPHFLAHNLATLSGRTCPPTGPGFLRRLIEYATSAGYLCPDPGLLRRSQPLI